MFPTDQALDAQHSCLVIERRTQEPNADKSLTTSRDKSSSPFLLFEQNCGCHRRLGSPRSAAFSVFSQYDSELRIVR